MPLEQYAKAKAKESIKQGDAVSDSLPRMNSRTLDFMEAPDKRLPRITKWFVKKAVEAEYKMRSEIFGEGADIVAEIESYWGRVAELSSKLSFSKMSKVPVNMRSGLWYDVQSIIMSVAQRQSWLMDDGPAGAKAALIDGTEMGRQQKKLLKGVTREQLKGASFAINKERKAIRDGNS